ncbi:XkdX family protein [Melissococcus plutonius]
MKNKFPTVEDIKLYYDWNCYTDDDIKTYVQLGTITQEDYKTITGKPFS